MQAVNKPERWDVGKGPKGQGDLQWEFKLNRAKIEEPSHPDMEQLWRWKRKAKGGVFDVISWEERRARLSIILQERR